MIERKKFKGKCAIFVFFAFIVMFSSSYIHADGTEYEDRSMRIKPEEKAIFAFFRAAQEPPDYDFWIKSQSRYQNLPSNAKNDYYIDEVIRLGRGYGDFDLRTDILRIYVDVMAQFVPANEDEGARIKFRILNIEDHAVPSFDFPFGDGYIALVISDLQKFSDLPVPEEKADFILQKIPYVNEDFNATLEVHVRVNSAEYGEPTKMHNVLKWVMSGEIAYIKCNSDDYYSNSREMLWDYSTPWYDEILKAKRTAEEKKYPHPYDLFKD